MNKVLLDTHVLIWLINGDETLDKKVLKIIREVSQDGILYVSAISIWEIALLESKNKITLDKSVDQWIECVLKLPYMSVMDLNHKIALESCRLVGNMHQDPADRFIVATARVLSIPLITRDERILTWSKQGHIKCIKA